MAPPRKRRATDADPAPLAPDPGDHPAPAPPDTPPTADPAPLTPPDDDAPTPSQDHTSQAAPLTPPETPQPQPVVYEPPLTPPPTSPFGQAPTYDLRWEDGTPADPDQLFTDPGAQYSYMVVTRRVLERYLLDGAQTYGQSLRYNAGARIPRAEADRIRARMAPS
ncbi:hypothetical protein SAMN05421505_12023 [Sinosporangium album]|uniref:Uncharacterized protein n=1 Tax=Sinosporangium album TaxID=504805 RepID=A0A1G8EB56_9ACTN|nr:hypothetical protein [Sinosporangium album]SDH67172.1 hypothetical protein SAMN05421505_12023 [Sinosporangium album]